MSLYILLALDDESYGASFSFYFEHCFIATHKYSRHISRSTIQCTFSLLVTVHTGQVSQILRNYLILYARCTAVYAIHKCSMFIFSLSILHASCTPITVARASFRSILSSRVIHTTVLIPGRSTSSFNLNHSPWDIRTRESHPSTI